VHGKDLAAVHSGQQAFCRSFMAEGLQVAMRSVLEGIYIFWSVASVVLVCTFLSSRVLEVASNILGSGRRNTVAIKRGA